jgi:DUF1680 family protein
MRLLQPAEVEPRGLFGERLRLCRERVLLAKDEDSLLAGFERRPGSQAWIGEHAGKWLDAACTELERTRDERLAAKVGRVAARLRAAQESDGWLGTYLPAQRFTEWDVWVHKYVLLGLLAHHRATDDAASLESARRIGELLARTFSADPRDARVDPARPPLSLVDPRVSTHAGMAAGSVLVAIVRLHRATGDERFAAFARSIVAELEGPRGPRIAAGLSEGRGLHEIGNGKAYEMLSCLCGYVELGDDELVAAAIRAFDDAAASHLIVTGGLSFEEHFRAPGTAPSTGEVSETCALVTWMQLGAALFERTGERRFLDPFERAAWNHLLAAQRPDGSFGYFTPLAGRRLPREGLHCCGSSGPRGLALVPQAVLAVSEEPRAPPRIDVELWMDARAHVVLGAGRVEIELATDFASASLDSPRRRATLAARSDVACELVLHAPSWSHPRPPLRHALAPGVAWRTELDFERVSPIATGRGRESGRTARLAGPLVLARADVPRGSSVGAPFVPFFRESGDDAPLRVWQEAGE